MQCIIVSSENTLEFKDVKSITMPALSGELQILEKHAESFIALQKGQVLVDNGEKISTASISEGVCHVKDDVVFIIL